MCWQAAGLSQRETNDLLDTYVHEQIEEKGAGETHMYVCLLLHCEHPPYTFFCMCVELFNITLCRLGLCSMSALCMLLDYESAAHIHNIHVDRCAAREAFIREQMRKRLGQDADEAAATSSQMHPEDELYAVPSDLQVARGQQGKSDSTGCCCVSLAACTSLLTTHCFTVHVTAAPRVCSWSTSTTHTLVSMQRLCAQLLFEPQSGRCHTCFLS